MPKNLTEQVIRTAKPSEKPYEVRDAKLSGLILRVLPSGKKQYYIQYARGKRVLLGRADVLTPTQARNRAVTILANGGPERGDVPTLRQFLKNHYAPWVTSGVRKSGVATVKRLESAFSGFLNKKLDQITVSKISEWTAIRLKNGVSRQTVRRDVTSLKSLLSTAVAWSRDDDAPYTLKENPLKGFTPVKAQDEERTRHLDAEEERRLRATLKARDELLRNERRQGNTWRLVRGYELLPELGEYADHLTPLVLLALNTGGRRGELLSLKWFDVDFKRSTLKLRAPNVKNEKTRTVPMSKEAAQVLASWKALSLKSEYVFPTSAGTEHIKGIKSSWKRVLRDAEISDFNFHDCRHTFATKLVDRGVSLPQLKELLGHHSIRQTEKYVHTNKEQLVAAIKVLE